MPLQILLPLVVGGIAGIAVLLHLLGYSRQVDLSDPSFVAAQWCREFPDDQVEAIAMSDDGRVALVHASSGAGLLWAAGADTTARRADCAEVTPDATGLTVRFDDYGAAQLRISLPPQDQPHWINTLTASEAT